MCKVIPVASRLCIVWLLVLSPITTALELTFIPFAPNEVIQDQLSPITSELNKHFPGSYISVPKNLNQYLDPKSSMDITYADESIASLLITRFGYIPLLTSNEIIKATFVSLTNYPFNELKKQPQIVISVNKRDLLTLALAFLETPEDTNFRFFESNTNLLISLLKDKNMVGVLPEEDVSLLPNNLRTKLSILRQRKLSPIYFLMHPKHASIAKKLQTIVYEFHKNWDRSQTKYAYLNYYTLEKTRKDERDYLSSKSLYTKYNRVLKRINSYR